MAGAGPPPGSSLRQFACAALKKGANGFIPGPSWIAPPALGSGKFGTPCERMHWLNAKNAPSRLELLALLDDPQAVTVRAQPTAMSAIKRLWRWWSAGLLAWA